MKKLNKLFILTFFVTVVIFNINVFANTQVVDNVNVVIDGEEVTFENPILNVDGRNFFPMRELLNKLGIPNEEIYWEYVKPGDKTVTFSEFKQISFKVGSKKYGYNFMFDHEMDTAPIIYKGMMYLPIKYVAEANRFYLKYDDKTRTTTVITKQEDFPLAQKENLYKDFVQTTYPNLKSFFEEYKDDDYNEVLKFNFVLNSDYELRFKGSITNDFYVLSDTNQSEIILLADNYENSSTSMNVDNNTKFIDDNVFYSLSKYKEMEVLYPTMLIDVDGKSFFMQTFTYSNGPNDKYIMYHIARFEDGYITLVLYSVDYDKRDDKIILDMLSNYDVN